MTIPAKRRWIRLVAALVIGAAAAGCTSTVEGLAVRNTDGNSTNVRPLQESQLDDVLLSIAQLNGIAGATEMRVVLAGKEMADNSNAVSDPDCLGSIFGAEDLVYGFSDWTAMMDQVAREPGDGNAHWVKQTAVLYATQKSANDFIDGSASAWHDCAGFSVAVDDGMTGSIWQIGAVIVDDGVVTQVIVQEDSDGWECQHALAAVTNVSVETIACAFGVDDEAATMAKAILNNVANQ